LVLERHAQVRLAAARRRILRLIAHGAVRLALRVWHALAARLVTHVPERALVVVDAPLRDAGRVLAHLRRVLAVVVDAAAARAHAGVAIAIRLRLGAVRARLARARDLAVPRRVALRRRGAVAAIAA